MKIPVAALGLALISSAAFAQQPDPMVRALQKSSDDLKQAWVAARAQSETLNDQLQAATAKIKDLEAKISRPSDAAPNHVGETAPPPEK